MADLSIRHGDGQHFMRPDRVYRTSVLAPMVGYQPQADVQAVTMAFTQGPDRGMMLQGLGAMPGPIQRFLARLQAWIAERKARKFVEATVGPKTGGPPPFVPPGHQRPADLGMPGAAPATADQISPHLATQMVGMMDLMARRYGQGYPAAQATATVIRPLRRWYY